MPVIFSFGLIVRAMRCRARNLHVFVSLGTNGYALPLLLAAAYITVCHNIVFIGKKSRSCKLHCLQEYDYGYKNIATSKYRQLQCAGNETMLLLTSERLHCMLHLIKKPGLLHLKKPCVIHPQNAYPVF
jgi:hypothetical protein